MKSLFGSSLSALAASALFLATAIIPVNAADYTWDTVSGDAASITAGSGIWSTSGTNWNNAGTNVAWAQTSSSVALHNAIFGGEDGTYTVTLSGTTNAQSVAFNNSGYTLTSGTLTLRPTSTTNGTITVAANKTATINSILSYNNSSVAAVTVGSGGTLNLGGGTAGAGSANPIFNFSGDGTINLTGGTFTNNSSSSASTSATYGNAEINLISGTHAITPGSNAGANISSNARNVTYNLSGGTLSVIGSATNSINANLGIGNTTGTAYTSTLNVISGTLVTGTTSGRAGEIQIAKTGSSNGTLNVTGGTVTVGTGSTSNKIYFFKAGANEGYTANMTQSGGTVTANGIQFGGTAGTYDATSSANLTLTSGALYVGLQGITSGSAASALPISIKLQGGTIGASDTWSSSLNMKLGATGGGPVFQAADSVGAAKNITLSGVLSNDTSVNGTLTKTGVGTLILQGNNTFSGGVTIKNGTLESRTTQTTLGSGTVTMGGAGSSGATYITGQSNSNPFVINAPDSGSVVIGANGVGSGFTLSGGVTLNGSLTLQTFDNPISEINKATSILTGGVTGTGNLLLNNLGLAANIITISGSSVNHTGTITLSGTAATGDTTISAPIGSNVTGITQNSPTSRLVLSGSNSYACNLTINAGTVRISNNSNTANDVSTVTIASGGTLDLNYNGTDTVDKLVINGVDQAPGVYGPSATNIAQITGTGTLTVGAPQIVVEQPANTAIANGGSKDFGSAEVGSKTSLTFTIRNSGQFALNLTGTKRVAIGGTNADDFTVTADPITPVATGEETTFTVEFAPGGSGDRAATLTIASNDPDDDPFVINLVGNGIQPSAPEIAVQQPLGTNINSGSTKNFGEVLLHKDATSLTFTIRNTGDIDLNLSGDPDLIVIGGADAADFKVIAGPASSIITPGGNATFTVEFKPSAAGLRSATLTIPNDDSDEGSYVINLSGTGTTAPEIAVEQAGGADIPNNGGPQDFGTVVVGSDMSLTFTVRNIGSAALNLSSPTFGGANPSDFSVTPTSSSTVAVDGTTTFTVKFTPSAKGNRSAFVSIANNDSDEAPFVINLSGAAILPPEIAVEQPANTGISTGGSRDFGTVGIGFSKSLTFTIRNTGEADLNLTGNPRVAISGLHKDEFTVTPQPSASIAGADSTTFEVNFSPTAVGSRSAVLTIANNDSNEGSYVINLTGTSVLPPDIAVEQPANTGIASGGSKDFGTVTWGSSKSLTFTVRNTGLGGLSLTSLPRVVVSGTHSADFVVTASPTSYVAPGASTTFTVQFNPRGAGARNATLTIANNDFENESPYVINLEGTGEGGPQIAVEQPAANVIPSGSLVPVDFGTVNWGSSKNLTFTVRNSGTDYLYLTGTPRVEITGPDAAKFAVTATPAASVAGGSSTTFTVQFVPSARGAHNATLTIKNDVSGPYVINLTGTGEGGPEIAVEQPAANLIANGGTSDFGTVMRGSSKSLTYTVRNSGTAYLYLTGTPRAKIGGADAANFAVSAAPASSVAGGSSTTFTVQFVPSAKRVHNATLTIDTEANGSYVIDLAGTGDGDPEMAVEQAGNDIASGGSQDFGRVAISSSKSLTFTIRNTGNIGLNLTRNPGDPLVKISGYDKDSFVVTASPATSIAAGGSTNFTVQFTPSSDAPHSASLSIFNDDSNESPFVISLSGNSAAEIAVEQPPGTVISHNGSQDFGSADIGFPTSLTFTIRNSGGLDLNLTGSPLVDIVGGHASDFSVTANPAALVAANDGSTTFTVQFSPSALGARSAQLSIANDDTNENPYLINLTGTGTGASEMAVEQVADTEIANNGSQDFGSVLLGLDKDLTFTIRNDGDRPLNLTGNELVAISGTHAADFTVAAQPDANINGPGTATFTIKFAPSAPGARTASLSIANDDSDENPYVINLSGTAVEQLVYGSDHAGNYSEYSGNWPDASNKGTGFGPWSFEQTNAGRFIADPSVVGSNFQEMTTGGTVFGLWADGGGLSKSSRSFATPLTTHDRFSIRLGYVWDNGNRGLDLLGSSGTIFNFNISGSGMTWNGGSYPVIDWGTIRSNGVIVDLTFTRTSTGFLYQIRSPQVAGLIGSGAITAADVTGFAVYVGDAGGDPKADMRFNNLQLTKVATDVSAPTLEWANGFSAWASEALGASIVPANSDIVATGDSSTETLTTLISVQKYQGSDLLPVASGIIDTSTDGLWKVVYTVTDPSGNAASLTRVVMVGTPTPGWRKMQGPATKTIDASGQETVYGRIWLYDLSNGVGQVPHVVAELGISSTDTDPSTWGSSAWSAATYNSGFTDADDEYQATVLGSELSAGTYYYAFRFKVGDSAGGWSYAGVKADGSEGGPWTATEGGIGGPYANGTLVINEPATPFEDYMTSFGLTGDAALGTADPDGDGQSNDAEFAFGTDPSSGSSQQTTTVKEPGSIKLVYLQRDSGVTYTVKSFTDLSAPFESGVEVTPTASNPQPTGLPEGYTQYEATLSTTSGKGFLRVEAVR